jgi:hypothetical protein
MPMHTTTLAFVLLPKFEHEIVAVPALSTDAPDRTSMLEPNATAEKVTVQLGTACAWSSLAIRPRLANATMIVILNPFIGTPLP